MRPEHCALCGAAADNVVGPWAGRTTWELNYQWNEKENTWRWNGTDRRGGDECLWFSCTDCKGSFHIATYRDKFAALSEPDAKRAMELFLAGNPPRRWPWRVALFIVGFAIGWYLAGI